MAAVAATPSQTAATTKRTVPVHSTNSQDAMDTTMTGADLKGDDRIQSSVPSKRKSTPSEEVKGAETQKEKTQSSTSKKGNNSSASKGERFTLRNPPWAYLHLELLTQPASSTSTTPSSVTPPIDYLTARSYLTSALSQFLGLTGTSIPIDIVKLDTSGENKTSASLWIRVPHDDLAAVTAALSSWIGGNSGGTGSSSVAFRIRGKGTWLNALVCGTEDLFA